MKRLCASACFVCVAALWPVCAAAQGAPHRVFLSVLDSARQPIAGLTTADVTVVEAGTPRTVTRVSRATDPMRIVMLIDNSEATQSSINEFRGALKEFIDIIPGGNEIALIGIGSTPVVHQAPTIDHARLTDAARKLTSAGGYTVLLSALLEMHDRFVRKAADRWSMFVILTTDGPEGSAGVSPDSFAKLGEAMQANDVVVHAIVISAMGQGVEMEVSRALTQATSGHYDSISSPSAITSKLAALAHVIADQYARTSDEYLVEYTSDSKDPNSALKVSVARPGANITLSRQGRIR
jgi:Mg-chelatase subunit ChlD